MKRVLLLLAVISAGCDGDRLRGQPNPKDKFEYPSKVLDFGKLFAKNCAGCHGKDGNLGPAPPLNDPVFLAIVPDEVLNMVIAGGRPHTEMPAFAQSNGGTLTDEQVAALAKGIRETWGKSAAKGDWPAYVLPKEKGNIEQGKAVFARACAKCHGADGTDPKLAIHEAAFLSLASEQVLRRYVITGRSDLTAKMPTCAEGVGRPLSAADVNDVVALLMSWKSETSR